MITLDSNDGMMKKLCFKTEMALDKDDIFDSTVLSCPEFHIKRTYNFAFPFLNLRAFSAKNEHKVGSFKAYHHLLRLSVEKDKVGAGNE